MGNINGREDGGGTSQDGDGAQVSYPAHTGGDDVDFMSHSPPPSPRVSDSPLMFTPQVPVAPLQRPNEIQPRNSWVHTPLEDDDVSNEQGIPTMITWSYGGTDVSVEGSWDNRKTRKRLQRSGKDFSILKVLPSGVYEYRFIVDGRSRHSPDVPWTRDDAGNAYNVLDLQEYVPEDVRSISGFEPPRSPDSSYNNRQPAAEDYTKEPPVAPPHLDTTVLNAPLPPSSRPQHVVLDHLYVQKGQSSDSVVALGSTHRFLSKYVTVVLYKSTMR